MQITIAYVLMVIGTMIIASTILAYRRMMNEVVEEHAKQFGLLGIFSSTIVGMLLAPSAIYMALFGLIIFAIGVIVRFV